MNTLKSAALLVVLLGVLYGVYVALNKPDPPEHPDPTGDNGSPLIEFNQHNSPPTIGYDDPSLPPPPGRSPRGGYQSQVDSGAMPPPTAAPLGPSITPTSNSVGLSRSSFEAQPENAASPPAAGPSVAPPLDQSPAATATSQPAAEASSASPAIATYALRRDMAEAEQLIAEGKFRAALAKLTPNYAHAELPADQRTVLLSWLDSLAAKVIYSREHCLTAAHQVRKGETLYDVASQYNVEYRLLQNINSRDVSDPLILVPGTELKVVPGPFRADVNLSTSELTLLVGDLYAGRFPLALGDQPPQAGDYRVVDKRSQQKTYVGFDGRMIAANDPANPYGGWWISLGGEVAIHGSPATPGPKTLGCISLSPQDAKDVYGILSIGSDVRIHR